MMWWWSWFACGPSEPPAEVSTCAVEGEIFGTTWSVKWRAPTCEGDVVPGIERVLEEVDHQMSTWKTDSELNAVRRGGRVFVAEDTVQVVRQALRLADETGGAYDPTVQVLMEAWGFHGGVPTREPTAEQQESLARRMGWERVESGFRPRPWIEGHGVALDLSSIAKGHAVDRVAAQLVRAGHGSYLVEVGGEVRVGGSGPNGPWRFGVDTPVEGVAPGTSFAAYVSLSGGAMATSGNYRNLVEVDGRKVHHTMDPRTGRPAVTDVASATVVAPTCAEADALATAVVVLGSEAGLDLLESRADVDGLLLVSGPDGLLHRSTSGMKDFVQTSPVRGATRQGSGERHGGE